MLGGSEQQVSTGEYFLRYPFVPAVQAHSCHSLLMHHDLALKLRLLLIFVLEPFISLFVRVD